MRRIRQSAITLLSALVLLAPKDLLACAVCFGDKSSQAGKAADAGILTLLLIILAVLAGIATFFVYVVRRTARLEQENPLNTAQTSH
jgi:heme/copper-type cytochrome/quinol oxidase subunit 2